MNKPMQFAAIALATVAVLGGTATAAEVRTGAAAQKQRGAQAAQSARKEQPVHARKRTAPATSAAAKPAPKRPVAAAKPAPKAQPRPGPASAATATAKAPARAAGPARPEVHWTQLPPSRFYPNGIPELRPEFLHPLPSQRPMEAVAGPGVTPLGPSDRF